jgi:DNA-binding GntR family transcriptional regulator
MESDERKYGQKLKHGDAHVTPRNIKEVQASKLGDAPEAPLLHRQKSGHLSRHYIFIASYSMSFSWSVFTFAFSFLLFCLLQ